MKRDPLEYTCIFGGGAIRGIAYIGAQKVLEEMDIKLSRIAGSSVGAIFAGLIAVGYTASELNEIFMDVNFELFRDIHFGFGKAFALSKGNVFLEWIRDLIEKKFYGDEYKKGENPSVTFKDIDKDLIIITTDLTNFRYKEFSRFETPDYEIAAAIRISSTMPGLMTPVNYNNMELVDGDLQKSWPLWKLSKNLCPPHGRVLEFRLEGDYEGKGKNAIDFINTVYSCVTSMATNFIIETYGNKDKFDYVKINTGSVVILDFNQPREKREKLVELGYNQTMEYFSKFLPQKKESLYLDYVALYKIIKNLRKSITTNNISKAQRDFGEIFTELCELKDRIDLIDYKKIRKFKSEFDANLNPPSLFGRYSLKNYKMIKTKINEIEADFKEKVEELQTLPQTKNVVAQECIL